MNEAIIGIGANLEAEKNIRKAIGMLQSSHELVAESAWKWTKPVGFDKQPDFLNGAVYIRTRLGRRAFCKTLKAIEKKLGRKRSACKFGPRTIDLDIVVWNGTITDRDIYVRDFLKEAVLEVMPDLAV